MPSQSLDFGLPGVGLEAGDHLCAIYVGSEERDNVLLPYLRAGLEGGHKCVGVVDAVDPNTLLARLEGEIAVDGYLASTQLQLWSSIGTYIQDGMFSPDRMIEFWEAHVAPTAAEGRFDFVRVFGEMCWSLREIGGSDELAAYESEINDFAPKYPQVILCLYDLDVFGGGIVVDLLATHPKLLMGGMIIDNPHYLSPSEYRNMRR